jgi:hypothetical protein
MDMATRKTEALKFANTKAIRILLAERRSRITPRYDFANRR